MSKWLKVIIGVSFMILLSLTLPLTSASTQAKARLLKKQTYSNEPISITNLQVNSREIAFDKGFPDSDDWAHSITFTVQNNSGKTITHLKIDLLIPDATGQVFGTLIPLIFYGNNTAISGVPASASLRPSETLHVVFASQYEKLPQKARSVLMDINDATLFINTVVFEDDTMWHRGYILKRDQNAANKWIKISNPVGLRQNSKPIIRPVGFYPGSTDSIHTSRSYRGCGEYDYSDWFQCTSTQGQCMILADIIKYCEECEENVDYVPVWDFCYYWTGDVCDSQLTVFASSCN